MRELQKRRMDVWRVLRPLCGVLLLCGGCRSITLSHKESAAGLASGRYLRAGGSVEMPERWWEVFKSTELDRLVDRALAGNLSLAQAEARLRQAQATARRAGASLTPDVSLSAEASTFRQRVADVGTDSAESYGLGLAASYEVDLWGRVRAGRDAAALSALGSREDLESAAMSLVGEVVDLWLQQVQVRAQLAVVQAQLESNRKVLALIRLRQRRSLASALDVYQQEQAVAATEALLPRYRSQLDLAAHQLAVLTGRVPGAELDLKASVLPAIPGLPDTGLPADLLAKRPDVRSAFLRLQSAQSGLVAAKADRLPALRLTGSAAYGADTLDVLLDNWILSLAGSLAAPVLDGGERRAEVDRTEAVLDEALAAYRATVLEAVREVEDALVRERHQADLVEALEREFNAAQSAWREADRRYRKGIIEYLPVLQALATRQQLERQLVAARYTLLSARVQLYRALGGTWTRDMEFMAAGSGEESVTD